MPQILNQNHKKPIAVIVTIIAVHFAVTFRYVHRALTSSGSPGSTLPAGVDIDTAHTFHTPNGFPHLSMWFM